MVKVRLIDIAQLADVSVATVSLVLNNKPNRISKNKRAEIEKIAKELNYIPNLSARQLVNRQSNTIGLIVPDLENMFFSSYVKKFQKMCLKQDYFVLVADSNDNYRNDLDLIDLMISKGVDAIVVAPSIDAAANDKEYISHLKRLRIPYVVIDRVFNDSAINSVSFDNELGMYLATKLVIKNNHKKIAFINGDDINTDRKIRYNGFKKAVLEENLDINEADVFNGSYTFESGYKTFGDIIKKSSDYSAVVAANDLIAYGVMKKANELGIRIPEDISIVGYDNLIFSSMLNVPLTTVDQNINMFVKETGNLIKKIIKDKSYIETIVLQPKLLVRTSVKKL